MDPSDALHGVVARGEKDRVFGDVGGARDAFERVLELDPDNEGARTLLEQLRQE